MKTNRAVKIEIKEFIINCLDISLEINSILMDYGEQNIRYFYYKSNCPYFYVKIEGDKYKHTDHMSNLIIDSQEKLILCRECHMIFNFQDLFTLVNTIGSLTKNFIRGDIEKTSPALYEKFNEANENNSVYVNLNK